MIGLVLVTHGRLALEFRAALERPAVVGIVSGSNHPSAECPAENVTEQFRTAPKQSLKRFIRHAVVATPQIRSAHDDSRLISS